MGSDRKPDREITHQPWSSIERSQRNRASIFCGVNADVGSEMNGTGLTFLSDVEPSELFAPRVLSMDIESDS
jgi:hypothetical protein